LKLAIRTAATDVDVIGGPRLARAPGRARACRVGDREGVVTVGGVSYSPLDGQLALARSAVPRAAIRRTDEEWLGRAWSDPSTAVLLVDGDRTLVDGESVAYLAPSDVPADAERYFLGADGERAYFAARVPLDEYADPPALDGRPTRPAEVGADPATGGGIRAAGLREIGSTLDERDAGLVVLAAALARWHETHRHCPRCGARTEIVAGGFVRVCPVDASEHYPRTDPAIIVLVTDDSGQRCLLGRGSSWAPGRFSTLAGFVEPGESAEAAVVREVEEETRVVVSGMRYLGSQPWPFPSSLMLGYIARAESDIDPAPDGTEVAEARWYSRTELALALADGTVRLPAPVSIARRLIEYWYGEPLSDGLRFD
jgi:NAD+ diphosphatase